MKRIINKLVSKNIIKNIRYLISQVDHDLSKIASQARILSSIYYVFNNKFSGEHNAVLKGRVAYKDSMLKINTSSAMLRRNIHRLEKGLIMRPRRSVFAENFIQETVDCYGIGMKSTLLDIEEKKWATDVLEEYFSIIGLTTITEKACKKFESIRKESPEIFNLNAEFPSNNQVFKPYPYSNLPKVHINYEELKQLFIRRRSVRWYQDKLVPLESVRKAVNIASFAPSACNRQPYRFVFCNKKEKVVKIAKCAIGTTGFVENLPAIIAIVGDLSAYPYERDRHVIYIDGSLAAMQLMLALETLELSSCAINWPDIDANERKIRKIIELKDYERVIMLLVVGYADTTGGIPYSQKKQNNSVLEDISK